MLFTVTNRHRHQSPPSAFSVKGFLRRGWCPAVRGRRKKGQRKNTWTLLVVLRAAESPRRLACSLPGREKACPHEQDALGADSVMRATGILCPRKTARRRNDNAEEKKKQWRNTGGARDRQLPAKRESHQGEGEMLQSPMSLRKRTEDEELRRGEAEGGEGSEDKGGQRN